LFNVSGSHCRPRPGPDGNQVTANASIHALAVIVFSERGQAVAADDVEMSVLGQRQRTADAQAPRTHRRRLRIVPIQFQQRPGLGAGALGARRGSLRAGRARQRR
jgi:hypothetical protein